MTLYYVSQDGRSDAYALLHTLAAICASRRGDVDGAECAFEAEFQVLTSMMPD